MVPLADDAAETDPESGFDTVMLPDAPLVPVTLPDRLRLTVAVATAPVVADALDAMGRVTERAPLEPLVAETDPVTFVVRNNVPAAEETAPAVPLI